MPAEVTPVLNADQRKDLVELLGTSIVPGAVIWMIESVLGRDQVANLGNTVSDRLSLSKRAVDLLERAGKVQQGIDLLLATGGRHTRLVFGLNRIVQNQRMNDGALQAFTNEYEPFMSTAGVSEVMQRLRRVVCAIGLAPLQRIVGTGFLIGPDLVLTNYHVLKTFMDRPNGKWIETGRGTDIHCFFDYLWEPAPAVPAPNPFKHHTVHVQAVAQNWLVHARPNLDGEGEADCKEPMDSELDYAVIKLEHPIGQRPTRLGGGVLRGWIPLEPEVDVLAVGARLMVFQHPAGVAQQFDFGQFVRPAIKQTRVWYSVSAAKGSSGGATVRIDGKLFALHNAEVKSPPALQNEQLNQGVRIDHITEDLLRSVPGWTTPAAAAETDLGYWSLNDDPLDPLPIIGRTFMREAIQRMSRPDGKRAMLVRGPQGSGVRFSTKLLRRVLGVQAPVIVFSPKDLADLGPKAFLEVLADQLGLSRLAEHPVPAAKPTENLSRWLRTDLPEWLFARLKDDAAARPSLYPAWIVIDAMTPPDQRLRWADMLKDLIAALVGVRDAGETAADVTQLRWLFLSSGPPPVPLTDVSVEEDDLCAYTINGYTEDFSQCMQLAWRCVNPDSNQDVLMLRAFAAAAARDAQPGTPVPKLLANMVRNVVVAGRALGGGQ